ncbi:hypothetical protein [Colwellia sp. UCD-KL20]|uniref:hypothetical protein n=1 Tax=Colwellia sp. UCD-KL20 TaxID=1917165 RepID=UPI0009705AB6|nr:hypothetical protein [Colwellia sp. UCD-KL20]
MKHLVLILLTLFLIGCASTNSIDRKQYWLNKVSEDIPLHSKKSDVINWANSQKLDYQLSESWELLQRVIIKAETLDDRTFICPNTVIKLIVDLSQDNLVTNVSVSNERLCG